MEGHAGGRNKANTLDLGTLQKASCGAQQSEAKATRGSTRGAAWGSQPFKLPRPNAAAGRRRAGAAAQRRTQGGTVVVRFGRCAAWRGAS